MKKQINTLSRYELFSLNGAGLRLIDSLIQTGHFIPCSIYWSTKEPLSPQSHHLDSPSIWEKSLFALKKTNNLGPIVLAPDSIQDCLICLPTIVFRRQSLVWFMDDFWLAEIQHSSGFKKFLKKAFAFVFMQLCPKVAVISEKMSSAFKNRFVLFKEPYVIYPTKKPSPKKLAPSQNFSSWIYIGSLKNPYSGPFTAKLSDLFMKQGINVDIYGTEAPALNLDPKVFHYRGSFAEEQKAELLAKYSVGLISYSLDPQTKFYFQSSFSSKLMDYTQSSLAIAYVGPEDFYTAELIESHGLGQILNHQSEQKICSLKENLNLFQKNAEKFQENFSFNESLKRFLEALR